MSCRATVLSAAIAVLLQTAAAASPAVPHAEPGRFASLIERTRALLAAAEGKTDEAAAWARLNLTRDKMDAVLEDLRGTARAELDAALAAARDRNARTLGLRTFNGGSLSLGEPAWSRLPDGTDQPPLPARVVLLIHGLDEPGDIWNDLTPELATRGYRVCRFDYRNDGPVADAASCLVSALRDLRKAGASNIDLVCHSMGGLVARDALTRSDGFAGNGSPHADLPAIDRLIMIGTPNTGSPWAHLQFFAEARDQFQRWLDSSDRTDCGFLVGWMVDGRGEAASDLLPGSQFLTALNARPLPTHTRITTVVGRGVPITAAEAREALDSRFVRALLTTEEIEAIAAEIQKLSDALGDGPVSVQSADLAGVEDRVEIDAAHNAMLRRLTISNIARAVTTGENPLPPAVPLILDRLERP